MPNSITFAAMLSIYPKAIKTAQLHGYLLGSIAPRPICFASTIDAQGRVNLAPYSFFNVFSACPPILVFSPARRVRDNTVKHTLENVQEVAEVVINVVSYAMVQQMSLASTDYPKGVSEFKKAGFTELPSACVAPPRVAEAPVQLECKVIQVVPLGDQGGAGNLVMAELLRMHINEDVLDDDGVIDPRKIDLVSRLGADWYSRAKDGLFEVAKPLKTLGIGVDALPNAIKHSRVLTGNDLGQLANIEVLPEQAFERAADDELSHEKAKTLLQKGQVEQAWSVLLKNEN